MQTMANLTERTKWVIDYVAGKYDLSNSEIGSAVGSKPNTIRNYRLGKAMPRLNFIQKFCDCYKVDFQWFFKGTGEPFPEKNIQYSETRNSTGSETVASSIQETAVFSERTKSDPEVLEGSLSESVDSPEDSAVMGMDCEMSFQKLAILADIKIDNEWIFNLSKKLGVESWEIGLSIYHQQISNKLIQRVEDFGYKQQDWIVEIKAGNIPQESGNGDLNISQLLKIAEKVLRSNTIHSTSLSLNIISLKMLADQNTFSPVMGSKAIIPSRKNNRLHI